VQYGTRWNIANMQQNDRFAPLLVVVAREVSFGLQYCMTVDLTSRCPCRCSNNITAAAAHSV
jgi:hypothetical protein